MFSLNEQSILGTEYICKKINETALSCKKESPRLLLIPSSVKKYLEIELINKWYRFASMQLAKYCVTSQKKEIPLENMYKNSIPYLEYYSFGARIINQNYNDDLLISYRNLKNLILEELDYRLE